MLMALSAIIITLFVVVGIHEAGHALAAILYKVKIKRISIGFGKPILQWRSAYGWDWVWGIWPLGGYVQLQNSRINRIDSDVDSQSFDKKSLRKRFVILIAGIVANLLTAWFAFVFVFYIGMHHKVTQVASVQNLSPAAVAGIHAGDQWLSIGGHLTSSWNELGMQLILFMGQKAPITWSNTNHEIKEGILDLSQISFDPKKGSLLNHIGINPDKNAATEIQRSSSLLGAFKMAFNTLVQMSYFFLVVLKLLVTRVLPFSVLLGPLGLFSVSIASFQQGIAVFVYFLGTFSLSVALVNLFPIPGLDGGSIAYLFLEKMRGKPLSVEMEVLLYQLMLILFSVLLVQLVLNDLVRML